MVQRNQRGDIRCTSAAPWRSRTASAPSWSTTGTTTPSRTSANAPPPCSRSPTATPPTPWPKPACSAPATPTPSTPGSTITCKKGFLAYSPTSTAATAVAAFSRDQRLKEELQERLQQGPGEPAQRQ